MDSTEPAFERLAHVEKEMPSVGDLESSGSACRRRSGVLGRAVAGDDLDAGMAPQPVGHGCPGSVGQQVDRASTVESDEQRAVGSSFADGLIVDAHGPRPIRARQWQAAHETQDRVGAGLHPQMVGQARTGLASGRKPDAGLGLGEAARPACSRRHQLRE